MMDYTVTDEPKREDEEALFNNLKEFNLAHIELDVVQKLAVFQYDENGTLVAGLSAKTHGNWLSVSYLWIAEKARGKGLGSKMLKDAEDEAVKRGCRFAFLDTFSFQAKDFYLKMGYQEVFTLEHYPVTGKRHYFTKPLA